MLFVPFISTTASLLAGLLVADKDLFYLASMLVAIAMGFTGDSLAGKLGDMIKKI